MHLLQVTPESLFPHKALVAPPADEGLSQESNLSLCVEEDGMTFPGVAPEGL